MAVRTRPSLPAGATSPAQCGRRRSPGTGLLSPEEPHRLKANPASSSQRNSGLAHTQLWTLSPDQTGLNGSSGCPRAGLSGLAGILALGSLDLGHTGTS